MIETLESWLYRTLPTYGYILLFVGSLLENIVTLSLIVPGTFLLALSGVLAGQGILKLPTVIFVAYLGTLLGDQLSYWIGRSNIIKISNLRINGSSNKIQWWIAEAYLFFIILAHFSPFIRSFGPVTCGALKIPYRRWLIFDMLGAFIWVCTVTSICYLFGLHSHYMNFLEQMGTSITITLIIGLIINYTVIFIKKKKI